MTNHKTQTWCRFKLRDYDRRFPQPTDEHAQELGSLELPLLLNNQQDTHHLSRAR
ncbi:hypothetical protein [Ktedonobacter sp. SOSP1-52]|uniref:hypothetical protein n=1 Tax=Ktedonobacter sp. SOSP1-52 TaxID=2778366 RepID=UPI001915D4EB|nr:hypothetical protein [Ktedonobacter sp. SOSP1-52]